jgi:hypothetical protein
MTRRGATRLLLAVALAWSAARAGAAEPPAATPAATSLPATVTRLDAERDRLRAEAREVEARAVAIRREVSDLERRRQEVLRGLDAEAAALAAKRTATDADATRLEAGLAGREAEIEHVLRAGGRWVSFTHDIAPLLREKCVACHTPREPGGGHVLTHYTALLADGAAGPAVVPGDAESPLVTAVADGSMPKDGTPLTPADVDLIRRWVALGARLDGGADPEAPLVRIMPRVRQPDPPAAYPAPVPVSALTFHPDGTRLASSGYHEVLIWSVPEGRLLHRITNVAERVHGLTFHPDGRRLAVAAGTPGVLGEVKLFDVDAGRLVADLGVADDAFFAVAWAAAGSRLVAAGADASVRLFDFRSDPPRPLAERGDHADWVQAVALSPDGRRLLTASRDATAKVVDLATGRLTTTFAGHKAAVHAACWLGDGPLVATGGADGAVRIWNADTGKESRRIGGFAGAVETLCAVGTGRVVAGDRSGKVRVHATGDGKQVAAFDVGPTATTSLAVSADGRRLAVGSLDGSVALLVLDGDGKAARWRAVPDGAVPVTALPTPPDGAAAER